MTALEWEGEEERGLTPKEAALAARVFGAALDTAPVRLTAGRLPFQPRRVVMAPWNKVYFGAPLQPDYTGAPPALKALWLHELTHCAQYQAGMNLVLRGAFAHGLAFVQRRSAYDYALGPAPMTGRPFEHQAAIVEDAFRVMAGLEPRRSGARGEDLARALGHRDLASARASLSLGAPPLLSTPLR